MIRAVYYRGNGLGDLVVRYWPKLKHKPSDIYSHVAVIRNDEKIESEPGKGVQCIPYNEMTCICQADVYEIKELTIEESNAAWAWLNSQKGKKYDWLGIVGYAFRWFCQNPAQWFCSELVEQMSENIVRKLTAGYRPNEVTPSAQAKSGRLIIVGSFQTILEKSR